MLKNKKGQREERDPSTSWKTRNAQDDRRKNFVMECIIFDGKEFAKDKELQLHKQVEEMLASGKKIRIQTFTFLEDEGSRLYTKLKSQAAERIGIVYEPVEVSIQTPLPELLTRITKANQTSEIGGVMVQKPTKDCWEHSNPQTTGSFAEWWETIAQAIDPQKDVDCLTKENLEKIGTREQEAALLPATVRACVSILHEAKTLLSVSDEDWKEKKIVVIGRSDIVGKPLAQILKLQGHTVRNIGKRELADSQFQLNTYDIVISATGVPNLITGEKIKLGAVVIDVGSPHGDAESESVQKNAQFLTPVPGGVGPVTVVSLMENCLLLA